MMTLSVTSVFSGRVRIFLSAAVALAVVLATAGIILRETNEAYGKEYPIRQKIAARSSLHFSFPERMDHAAVEKALQPVEQLSGTRRWEDDVFVIEPDEPLAPASVHTFVLPATAQTAEGKSLGRELRFVFTVAGPPVVTARIPVPDTKNVSRDSKITVVFDRPMIPLSQVQGDFAKDAEDAWPISIEPPVKGRWRWISTVAREFIPEEPLTEGTWYAVNVPAGIVSVLGDATEENFSWNFETVRPEVLSTEPEQGSALAGPQTAIRLTFNRPIDLRSATEYISLSLQDASQSSASTVTDEKAPPSGKRIALREMQYGTQEVDGKNMVDPTTVIVRSVQPLAFASAYLVTVAEGLLGTEGTLGIEKEFRLRFSTVGDLTVRFSGFESTSEEIRIDFSNPIDAKTLESGIRITPAPPSDEKIAWTVNDWADAREVRGYFSTLPSTTYTVSVGTQVQDQSAQSLKEPYTFTFQTPPTLPRAFIHSKGEFGIFERGKPPIFYMNAVNVSRLDVSFARLTPVDLLRLRATDRYGQATLVLEDKPLFQSWRLPTARVLNEWEVIAFNPEERLDAPLAPGIYAVQMTAPEYMQPWDQSQQAVERQIFAITNLAMTLKYSGDDVLVWVTDMQTGDVVPDARITLHTLDGRTPIQGRTDEEGFFTSSYSLKDFVTANNEWEPEFWVTAETKDDTAMIASNWNDGIRPWHFDLSSDFRSTGAGAYRADGYLYTERPIYQAGDTVFFKGIVRLRDWDGAFSLPEGRKVTVQVRDAQGNEIMNGTVPISAFGSFSGSVVIDEQAALGEYFLQASLSPEEDIWNNYMGTNFSVLAYRKPEYAVSVTPEREDYFHGETASVLLEGSYYFGAPMEDAAVQWRVQTTDYFFNKVTDGWYAFSTEDGWCWYACERKTEMIAEGKGKLDAAGHMRINVPLSLEGKTLSQVYTIEADVTDANNQVVSHRASILVHQADGYVGLRTQEYVVQPGENVNVDVVTVRPDGTSLGDQVVTLQLFARTWNSIRKKSVDGAYYYDNEPKDTFVSTKTLRTDAKGKATAAVRIPDGGEYRIVALMQDAQKRETKAAVGVYAWSSVYFNWPHTNSDRMEVQADKPEYKPGETASLLIKSPYQGAGVKALVTVEREGILSRRVIDIVSNAQSIDIPITADLIPNAYVSVVVVKPRQGETFNEFGTDTGTPAFKIGYAKLTVDASGKQLHITVEPDKKQYGPGETVRVALRTTDAEGNAVPAELSLGTVDMSLLALSSFETPDLTRLFYAERGLGISTAHLLLYVLERFKPGSKGGGGADPSSRVRGNFTDTAYWNPSIVTDTEGKATVEFALPDNLTTWQLLAIGSTRDHRFGSKAVTVIETKQVIVRPVRPRFAVPGDRIELGAIVHNFLSETRTFTVRLSGSGFTAVQDTQARVTIPAGGQATVTFPMLAGSSDTLSVRVRAETEGAADEIVESIPIHAFSTPQTVATTGMTEKTTLEKVIAPSRKDAVDGTLTITAAPTLAAYLPDALDYLSSYPYGCTEQTLSAFLPAVALLKLDAIGSRGAEDRKVLEDRVTKGLGRLYAFQRGDGGFGYWESSVQSYAPLSAYVLYGLVVTKQAGFSVDERVIDRLVSYLHSVLRAKGEREQTDPAQRAAILFALAASGRGDLSLLNNVYEHHDALPLFARAQLALAYEWTEPGSLKARTIVNELMNLARIDSRGTHFEEEEATSWGEFMNTTDRTTALVLEALLTVDPENALIPNVMRFLLTARKDGHWDTTQSTVQALLAFALYLEQTGEIDAEFRADIAVNDVSVLAWDVKKVALFDVKSITLPLDDLKRGEENDIEIGLIGKGRLYYDLVLSYLFMGESIAPAEEGIGITRDVRPLHGQSSDYRVGETYVVTLTVTVPEERRFVAVESPVPAGMEVIDLTLETSQRSLLSGVDDATQSWDDTYWEDGLWRFSHREVRDDRFFLFAETLPAGVYQYHYLMRATTPGVYRERPARAFEMYFPEVFGQTKSDIVTIRAR